MVSQYRVPNLQELIWVLIILYVVDNQIFSGSTIYIYISCEKRGKVQFKRWKVRRQHALAYF